MVLSEIGGTADAADLGSATERCRGSNPLSRTNMRKEALAVLAQMNPGVCTLCGEDGTGDIWNGVADRWHTGSGSIHGDFTSVIFVGKLCGKCVSTEASKAMVVSKSRLR